MWFELFSALGGLGIAGFAILTELMAGLDRHYTRDVANLRRLVDHEEMRGHTFLFGGVEPGDKSPWLVFHQDKNQLLKPNEPGGRFLVEALGNRPAIGVAPTGIFFPINPKPTGVGTGFFWWPPSAGLADHRPSDPSVLKRVEGVAKQAESVVGGPFGAAFFAGAAFRVAALQLRRLRHYESVARARLLLVGVTALGWAGALIASLWLGHVAGLI